MRHGKIQGEVWDALAKRAADLCNEGWDVADITELLNGEGYKRPDSSPIDPLYTYSLLYGYREKGGTLRDGIRRPNGSICFQKKYGPRGKNRQKLALQKAVRFQQMAYYLLAGGLAVIGLTFILVLWRHS